MGLKYYKPKVEIKDFPKEIIEKMLENQVEQGNDENIEVFEKDRYCGRENGGFNYYSTKEGGGVFWNGVIDGYFDVFFSRYPKQEHAIEEATKILKKYGYHVFPSDEYGIPDLSNFEGVEVEVRNCLPPKWGKVKIMCKIDNNNFSPYITSDGSFYEEIRPVQEELDFDWDCLPKWADKYIAYSNSLAWNSYENKPKIEKELWIYEGQSCCIPNEYAPKNFKGSVKDSLFKNPNYKEEE